MGTGTAPFSYIPFKAPVQWLKEPKRQDEAQRLLDEQVEKAKAAGADALQAHLKARRRADEEIIKLAEEIEAGMIVVGGRGADTISRAFMDSDSESIACHADRS